MDDNFKYNDTFDWFSIFSDSKSSNYFVACSGGVDSMVLCFLMQKAQIPFEILHVNFQLRGEDSDKDEELVRKYGQDHKIKVHVQRFDTLLIAKEGGNLEQICRDLRYNWFRTFTDIKPNSKIVLAHHQDDLIETFYLHLARKSGMVGLSSLKKINGNLLRPLLQFTKKEIYDFAKKNHLEWREDKTNKENIFRRNKLRNTIIPSLEVKIPSLRNSILTLISTFQKQLQKLEDELKDEVDFSNHFEIKIPQFQNWPEDKKNLFLKELSVRHSVSNELKKLSTSETGKFINTGNWLISKRDNRFIFDAIETQNLPQLSVQTVHELPKKFDKDTIYLDAGKLQGALQLRKWQLNDRISALGVNGSKLVSKIINEARLSVYDKKNTFVVTDEEDILWIVGIKIGRKAIANTNTKEILKVNVVNSRTKVSG